MDEIEITASTSNISAKKREQKNMDNYFGSTSGVPPKKVSNVNRNDKEENKQTTQGASSRLT